MDENQSKLLSRRRLIVAGGVGAMALTALGLGSLRARQSLGQITDAVSGITVDAKLTVVAFIGALNGRELSQWDVTDLLDRLNYRLSYDAGFIDECAVLAQHLENFARARGGASFRACNEAQKDSIVHRIMTIDPTSLASKVLRRFSKGEHDYYRIRWSTIYQLSWIYKQSGVAWRARGYTRWAGIPGNWREILAPGAPYP